MLLTDARRAARVGADGELIPLDEQDRSRWDREAIEEGIALLSGALPRGELGPYQLQAAIAALHDEAPRTEDTDWPQILAFYGLLQRMSDNPMVSLNHAIATAMVHGPAAGLTLLDAIEARGQLTEHHRLPAVRAHLLEMAGDHAAALDELPHRRVADRERSGAARICSGARRASRSQAASSACHAPDSAISVLITVAFLHASRA